MSDPKPNEPLVRNPNTGTKETNHADDRPIDEKPAGMSIHHTDKQADDDEDIVGPDGDRG
jgi:hypothetical protein